MGRHALRLWRLKRLAIPRDNEKSVINDLFVTPSDIAALSLVSS